MFEDIILFEGETFSLGFGQIHKPKLLSLKDLKKAPKEELAIVVGGFGDVNRKILENKKVDILLIPENAKKEDYLHQRASGLNHILCKIAYKNGISIAFSFNQVLNAVDMPKLLGRMMQNIRLCRKYKVRMIMASFANNKWEMRSAHDLMSFAQTIGMTPGEAKKSLTSITEILEEKEGLVIEGVKIIKE